jgi:hypothetical protein
MLVQNDLGQWAERFLGELEGPAMGDLLRPGRLASGR